jgi:hypothetical protein
VQNSAWLEEQGEGEGMGERSCGTSHPDPLPAEVNGARYMRYIARVRKDVRAPLDVAEVWARTPQAVERTGDAIDCRLHPFAAILRG